MPTFHPIQPVLVVILATVLWWLKRKPKDGPAFPASSKTGGAKKGTTPATKPKERPEAIHLRLRQQALEMKREKLGLPPAANDEEVHGVVMEMSIADSVVTLAAFANGDATLLYQSGGGMSAGPAHPEVLRAVRELVNLGQQSVSRMVPMSQPQLTGADKVRFFALTPRGILTTETHRATIGQAGNDLSALFYAGQEVVSRIREAQPQPAG